MQITREQAQEKINNVNDGKVFTVTFVKRTTGETRVMNCRKGVKKHLKGGEQPYDPAKKGLVTVFDMQKGAYRMIALESIQKVAMEGEVFDIVS